MSMGHLPSNDEFLHHNIEERGGIHFLSSQVIFLLLVHT